MVAADSRAPRDGKFLEIVSAYPAWHAFALPFSDHFYLTLFLTVNAMHHVRPAIQLDTH
jgi:hypothetical protein